MMIRIIASFLIVCSACSPRNADKIAGTFSSTCYVQMYPSVTLKLRHDKTFTYIFAYNEDNINGTWLVKKDTLILSSSSFSEEESSGLRPISKITSYSASRDALLCRGKRLFLINKDGKSTECYLKRTIAK